MTIEKRIERLVKNWDFIPDSFKSYLRPAEYRKDIDGLKKEEHFVILLIDRQKPSVIASYDFDEERIGITRSGKIVYGFDSGCSCPTPWEDTYPDCYKVAKDWKEFVAPSLRGFEDGAFEAALVKIEEIEEAFAKEKFNQKIRNIR